MIRESYFVDEPNRDPVVLSSMLGLCPQESGIASSIVDNARTGYIGRASRGSALDIALRVSELQSQLDLLANSNTSDWRDARLLSPTASIILSSILHFVSQTGSKTTEGPPTLGASDKLLQEASFHVARSGLSRAKYPLVYRVAPPRLTHRQRQIGVVLLDHESTRSLLYSGPMLRLRLGITQESLQQT